MPDLLIELFSEEIPARMQARAAEDLKKLVTTALVEAGLTYAEAGAFATPRRLTLHLTGLPAQTPAMREERKGPRTDAPEQAIQGFLFAGPVTPADFMASLDLQDGAASLRLAGEKRHRIEHPAAVMTGHPPPRLVRHEDPAVAQVVPEAAVRERGPTGADVRSPAPPAATSLHPQICRSNERN